MNTKGKLRETTAASSPFAHSQEVSISTIMSTFFMQYYTSCHMYKFLMGTGGVLVSTTLFIASRDPRIRLTAVLLSHNDSGQVVHTPPPLKASPNVQYRQEGSDALRLYEHYRLGMEGGKTSVDSSHDGEERCS